jgi:hypothetical protein
MNTGGHGLTRPSLVMKWAMQENGVGSRKERIFWFLKMAYGHRSTRRSRTLGRMEYLCVSFLVPSMYHVRTVRTVIIDFQIND